VNKRSIKRGLGQLYGFLNSSKNRSILLLYHSVGDTPWAVTEVRFKEQVDWLSRKASVVSLPDLLKQPTNERIRVAITFDDGYVSLIQKVMPVFEEYGMTATVYLNTGLIADSTHNKSDAKLGHYPDEEFLSWPGVQKLSNAGWTVGSHGVNHDDLTLQGTTGVDRELIDSKAEIEERLGMECQHFSYTWGRYNQQLKERVRQAGYGFAVSGIHGPVKADVDFLAIPRINIDADCTLDDFQSIVLGDWDYLGYLQRARCLIS